MAVFGLFSLKNTSTFRDCWSVKTQNGPRYRRPFVVLWADFLDQKDLSPHFGQLKQLGNVAIIEANTAI